MAGWFRAEGDITQTRPPFRETDKALLEILEKIMP